jgi:hypothetical protein
MADKFEREIDEILSKIHDFPQRPAAPRRAGNRIAQRIGGVQRSLAVRFSRISVSQVMLTAMGLMVLSYFFKAALAELWVYGLILGLILFFTAFALSLRPGGRSPGGSEPYFRGQPRSYYTRANNSQMYARIRAWWRQQRRPRR